MVFAGPCLPVRPDARWRSLLGRVEVRPPARRGDVLAALGEMAAAAGAPVPRGGGGTLVLLDGYYYTVPAVTHKELLYALEAGVRVIGAASMGALRAAELESFGMIGVGRVFEAFRRGELDGDDEVAILHTPEERGYRPLTVALVEVRAALERLGERLGERTVWPEGGARELVHRLKATPMTERRPERLGELAEELLGSGGRSALEAALAAVSVKREDARAALERALAAEDPPHRLRRRPVGGYLATFKELYLTAGGEDVHGRPPAPLGRAWSLTQVVHPGVPRFLEAVWLRAALAGAAAAAGLEPAAGRRQELAEALSEHHRRQPGRLALPEPEYLAEAQVEALAEAGVAAAGGFEAACRRRARELGLDPTRPAAELVRLVRAQPDLVPAWPAARAFAFTPAAAPALAAAVAAGELARCFERRADGGRVAPADLERLAAELWGCRPEEVPAEGARRGLFGGSGLAGGLSEALERVAVAERLPRSINDYGAARERLAASPLVYSEGSLGFLGSPGLSAVTGAAGGRLEVAG